MYKQYINGELVQGAGVRVKVLDPADNSVIEELDTASEEQCLAALEAAQAAFKDWKMGYASAGQVYQCDYVGEGDHSRAVSRRDRKAL